MLNSVQPVQPGVHSRLRIVFRAKLQLLLHGGGSVAPTAPIQGALFLGVPRNSPLRHGSVVVAQLGAADGEVRVDSLLLELRRVVGLD